MDGELIGCPWPLMSGDGEGAKVISTSSISCWLITMKEEGGELLRFLQNFGFV